jgi:hypothetical protein
MQRDATAGASSQAATGVPAIRFATGCDRGLRPRVVVQDCWSDGVRFGQPSVTRGPRMSDRCRKSIQSAVTPECALVSRPAPQLLPTRSSCGGRTFDLTRGIRRRTRTPNRIQFSPHPCGTTHDLTCAVVPTTIVHEDFVPGNEFRDRAPPRTPESPLQFCSLGRYLANSAARSSRAIMSSGPDGGTTILHHRSQVVSCG